MKYSCLLLLYMKYSCLLLLCGLVGCSTMPSPIETVYVNKPILTSPTPPPLPKFVPHVDKLTPNSTPGEVGVAYKTDMMTLRYIESVCRQTFAEFALLPRPDEVATKLLKNPSDE